MALFNYDGCNVCKKRRCNKKMVLCNILPANVCNMIGEYVNDCWRCEWMEENEKHFFKGFTGENNDVNKPSNQLAFFSLSKKPFLTTHNKFTDNDRRFRKWKREIDRILDKQEVKDKYALNRMDLQAIKSYCKKDPDIIKCVLYLYYSKEKMNTVFSPFFYSNDNIFTYRNREYVARDLIKMFFVEYVDDLIGDDKIYCDMEGIKEHIDKMFEL